MPTGRCLCGAHRFELTGPLEMNHHCHCGYCRKHHGSVHVSLVGIAPERLTWQRGETIAYASSAGFARESCATCGSPLPQEIPGLPRFVPAGLLDDLETDFAFHIFVAHKAEWEPIEDDLPKFDAFPPGVESAVLPTRAAVDSPEGTRGSCLCGEVRYVVDGPGITARHCHCTRCRRARGAAHASNWVVALDDFRFTNGESSVRRYEVPEAKFFTQSFCGGCGGAVPTVDAARGFVVIPLGALDDPAPTTPVEHIWTADRASWVGFHDALPRREGPPAS